VRKLQNADIIRRELLLIKVKLSEKQRSEIIDIAKIMDCEIVDISHTTLTLELSDWPEKINLLIELLSKYHILEITRTGTIALQRGADSV
jgi:acetolactate synthase-1/3 small subunit